jgi:hypothetical protein
MLLLLLLLFLSCSLEICAHSTLHKTKQLSLINRRKNTYFVLLSNYQGKKRRERKNRTVRAVEVSFRVWIQCGNNPWLKPTQNPRVYPYPCRPLTVPVTHLPHTVDGCRLYSCNCIWVHLTTYNPDLCYHSYSWLFFTNGHNMPNEIILIKLHKYLGNSGATCRL